MRQLRRQRNFGGSTKSTEGQALVEMAIVIVLMIMLSVSSLDFGIYMYRYVQAANCVREAARRMSVRAPNASNPPYCADAGLTPTISPGDYQTAPAGTEVTATININHTWMALDKFIPGLTGTIKARTSMRLEGKVVT